MFGPAGHLYVYRIYGLHWCANVVTGPIGAASAVLLRAAVLLDGDRSILSGPGNLTRGLAITGDDNGLDCCEPDARVRFARGPRRPAAAVAASSRVGLSRETERPWRFSVAGHPAVSRPRPR